MSNQMPILLIFAGPNGSGKSSAINMAFQQGLYIPSLYINADIIKAENNYTDLEAAQEADRLRQKAINNQQSFITETVMSTPNKINLMRQAKANGYEVHLVYVTTQDPIININRVKDRYIKGGHDVPEDKIISRHAKAMQILDEALNVADIAKVYNNSFESPVLLLEKNRSKEIIIYNK